MAELCARFGISFSKSQNTYHNFPQETIGSKRVPFSANINLGIGIISRRQRRRANENRWRSTIFYKEDVVGAGGGLKSPNETTRSDGRTHHINEEFEIPFEAFGSHHNSCSSHKSSDTMDLLIDSVRATNIKQGISEKLQIIEKLWWTYYF